MPSKYLAAVWLKTSSYWRRFKRSDLLATWERLWADYLLSCCPSACRPLCYWLFHLSDPARLTTETNWKSSEPPGPFRETTATSAKSSRRLIYFWFSSGMSGGRRRERPQRGLKVKVLLEACGAELLPPKRNQNVFFFLWIDFQEKKLLTCNLQNHFFFLFSPAS